MKEHTGKLWFRLFPLTTDCKPGIFRQLDICDDLTQIKLKGVLKQTQQKSRASL